MRASLGPKLCRKHRGSGRSTMVYERWLKRYSARIFRRLGRRHLDEAPQDRRYNGYSD